MSLGCFRVKSESGGARRLSDRTRWHVFEAPMERVTMAK